MNSLPRWLISITDMPLPCQSSSSSAARRRTGSGRAAGPGLKLKGRGIASCSSGREHYRHRAAAAHVARDPSLGIHRRIEVQLQAESLRITNREECMRNVSWLAIGIAAALLSACGGSDDKVNFTQTVSFGDSLSDVGTYQVGTVAALGGGKFTVNGTGGKVWTEFLAADVGTPAQCAARTGLLPNNPQITGAPVQDFPDCYNYAEGSARVTSEGSGPNGVALQQSLGQGNIGLLADSLKNQFERHLAKVGGSYSGTELVTINAGGNDAFMQLAAVDAAAGGGQAAAATAAVAGWSPAVIATVTG